MKQIKRIIGMLLVFTMFFTVLGTSVANANTNSHNNIIKLDNGKQITEKELIEFLNNYEGKIIKISDYCSNKDIITAKNNNVQPMSLTIAIPAWAIGKWVIPFIGTVIVTPVAIYIGETLVEAGSALFDAIISAIENLLLSEESEERIKDVLKDKKHIGRTKGKADIYEGSGGYEQAKKDFDKLNDGEVKIYPNGTKVGELPDGRKINVRNHSSDDNRPTLEIQIGKNRTIKIRYK